MIWCNPGLYRIHTISLRKLHYATCVIEVFQTICVLFPGHQGHFTSSVLAGDSPRLLHLRIVSSWEVQWRSLERRGSVKGEPPRKGEPRTHPSSVKSIKKNRGRMKNDEIQDVLRWRKLMNTVSLGKVFNKSECYVNQWNVYIERSQPKTGALLLAALMSPITSCQIINQFDPISL